MKKGLDWTKKDLADALGRPDLKKFIAQALGSLGGKSRSKKKQLASKENGKKGGRPKKIKTL